MILRRLFCFALIFGFTAPCFAQQAVVGIDKRFSADVLKATLYARTAEEKKFCDYVIQKRDDGTIPTQLVYGIHQKAMSKDRIHRFTYFKSGLEIACKREGIALYPAPSKSPPRTSSSASAWVSSIVRGLF